MPPAAMSPDVWSRAKPVFEAALARSEAERAAFMAAACGGDDVLRAEVERLLALDSDAQTFFDRLGDDLRPPEALPERVGPWRIERDNWILGKKVCHLPRGNHVRCPVPPLDWNPFFINEIKLHLSLLLRNSDAYCWIV